MQPNQSGRRAISAGLVLLVAAGLAGCAEPTRPAPGETGPVFSADSATVRVAAGAHYARRGWWWRRLWGQHYRTLWATPVQAPTLRLGAVGLRPLRVGGSFQTNTLHLRSPDGRYFVLRSVDKDLSQVLGRGWPDNLLAPVLRDQTCAAPPYGAYVAARLARAARVYHTNPRLVYLLPDAALGEFRSGFRPALYLLEERPVSDQSHAPSFGAARRVVGSAEALAQVLAGPAARFDARAYLRARLLDLLVGDWSRRADQWRWAAFPDGAGGTVLRPIPRDRDQAFFRFDDGWLTRLVSWGRPRYRTFNANLVPADVGPLSVTARPLDHTALAVLPEAAFRAEADSLRRLLPNAVLAQALQAAPPGVRQLLTRQLLPALRARRDALPAVAARYYQVLQREPELLGTDAPERFELLAAGPGHLRLRHWARRPLRPDSLLADYRYDAARTLRLTVRALGGNDIFELRGPLKTGFAVHLYGGAGRNQVLQYPLLQPLGPGLTTHLTPADLVQVGRDVHQVPGPPEAATPAWLASYYRLGFGARPPAR